MNDLISKLKQPALWTISVQLMILYVVSVAVFYALHAVHKKLEEAVSGKVAAGSAAACAAVFLGAVALNFAGVWAVIYVTAKTGETIRKAMILVPLFLIIEAHVRRMREHPQERKLQLLGLAGVAAGTLGAIAALMRAAPLK
ncbi:MAG: hypothetical protein M0D55_05700 [Elusimicrobiota bacterium]|nr:MAG: hypothetical protein M0D55_05700 [Elusimicrobiota bacterium]